MNRSAVRPTPTAFVVAAFLGFALLVIGVAEASVGTWMSVPARIGPSTGGQSVAVAGVDRTTVDGGVDGGADGGEDSTDEPVEDPPADPVEGSTGESEAVIGTLRNDGEPVSGVRVSVVDAAGVDIGSATTDDAGMWRVALPGAGDYVVSVDPSTLPDGVGLRDDDRSSLEVSVSPNQVRRLLFALGPRVGGSSGGISIRQVLQLTVEGIKFGLLIAMTSVGLSLIFGTTGLVNFAHGELVTLGALVAYFFNVTLGLHFLFAAPIAVVVCAGLGAGFDRGFWRPLRKRGTGLIAMLVISIGVSILARYVFLYQFGGPTRPYGDYALQTGLQIGPVVLAPKDLLAIILSVLILVAIAVGLQRTRLGKAMRAVSDNRDLAESSGIDVERVILYVWALGSGLAAIGGIMLGLTEQVSWQMGFQLLLLMFAGVTLGGLGTAYGALVGSLVVGLFIQLSTLFISTELKNVGALVILIVILLIRPQGILGQAERVG